MSSQDELTTTSESQLGFKETVKPPSQRVPPEIWKKIAVHIPRYHLRKWLFVSHFHRGIASRHIFRTIDIKFWENDDYIRAKEIFDRAKNDPIFANHVKSLRLHWDCGNENVSDSTMDMLKTSLPVFKALREIEWNGFPEMHGEMFLALLDAHKHLPGLGLIGLRPDHEGVPAFDRLRKITLCLDGYSDIGAVYTLLDRNERTLKHLILGGSLVISWDLAFESMAINNLTHLDLVDTHVSHFILTRVASAHNLQSLALHRAIVDQDSASIVFASDRVIGGSHTLWPHLEAFRLPLVGPDDQYTLYRSLIHFLRKRDKLRRLALGSCPWDILQRILQDLRNLRVLEVHISLILQEVMKSFVESIPREMVAISVFTYVSDRPLDQYASYFTRFHALSFLHLRSDVPVMDSWSKTDKSLCSIAATIPSLDFLVWNTTSFVVVRRGGRHTASVRLEELPKRCFGYGGGVDLGSDDAAWLEHKDVPMRY